MQKSASGPGRKDGKTGKQKANGCLLVLEPHTSSKQRRVNQNRISHVFRHMRLHAKPNLAAASSPLTNAQILRSHKMDLIAHCSPTFLSTFPGCFWNQQSDSCLWRSLGKKDSVVLLWFSHYRVRAPIIILATSPNIPCFSQFRLFVCVF